MSTTQILAICATALTGLLAGMSLDQSVKQLPARHRIGVSAFSAYQRAADLKNGVYLYAGFGVGSLVAALAAAVGGHLAGLSGSSMIALNATAGLSILHSIVTAFAAPTDFSQRTYALDDEAALKRVFDRFERLQALRAILQLLAFGALLWAVVRLSA
jgi:hypothetical protein